MHRTILLSQVLLMALVQAAWAQAFPQHYSTEPDEFTLEYPQPGGHYAYVEYYNSAARSSGHGHMRELTNMDLTVELRLTITMGPEILEVIPPAGWRAEPPTISVPDGERGVIELFRGTWEGM